MAESGEKKHDLLAEQVLDIIWTMKPDGQKPEFELIFFTNPPMAVSRA